MSARTRGLGCRALVSVVALSVAGIGLGQTTATAVITDDVEQRVDGGPAGPGDLMGQAVDIDGSYAIVGVPGPPNSFTQRGTAYVYLRSGTSWSLQAELVPTSGSPIEGQFGWSVDLSGAYAIVGAPGAIGDRGQAFVFKRSATTWSQQAELTGGSFGGEFGYSVSIDGSYAAVGEPTSASGGVARVYLRSGTVWAEQAAVSANQSSGDRFGASVSIDGSYLVAGSPLDDPGGKIDAGTAHVFKRAGTTWPLQATLDDSFAGWQSGTSVSLDGSYAMVGAPKALNGPGAAHVYLRAGSGWTRQATIPASGDTNFGVSVDVSGSYAVIGADLSQSATVFRRSGTSWTQQQELFQPVSGLQFGRSVALQGSYLVAGMPGADSADASNVGQAFAYFRSTTGWSVQKAFQMPAGAGGDQFGYAVAVDGDYAVIGAPADDGPFGPNDIGSVYVFVRTNGRWLHQAKLVASGGGPGDRFGSSVGISGSTIVVGAPNRATQTGAAYIFTRAGTTWTQQAQLTRSDPATQDFFGYSVGISGSSVVVGSPGDDTPAGTNTGSLYAFVRAGATWVQQAKLVATDAAPSDQLGISVGLSGTSAIAGAPSSDATFGSAYVFTRTNAGWTQTALLAPPDRATTDQFGFSVAIDGTYAIVGSIAGDVGAPGNTGSAYVFQKSGSSWVQRAEVGPSDGAPNDLFGYFVGLSGSQAVVGAPNGGQTLGEGEAFVFQRAGTAWTQTAKLSAVFPASNDNFGFAADIDDGTALVGALNGFAQGPLANGGFANFYGP